MRPLSLLLPLLLVAGCGSDPAYPPPTDAEASEAYVRAIRADLIDSPAQRTFEGPTAIEPGDTPSEAGHKAAGVLDQESETSARLDARGRIESLDRVTLGECSWAGIDAEDVKPLSRQRVEGQVEDGYECDYEVFHDTETRGPVSAKGRGFFFHRDRSYDFAGSEESSFEEVRR